LEDRPEIISSVRKERASLWASVGWREASGKRRKRRKRREREREGEGVTPHQRWELFKGSHAMSGHDDVAL